MEDESEAVSIFVDKDKLILVVSRLAHALEKKVPYSQDERVMMDRVIRMMDHEVRAATLELISLVLYPGPALEKIAEKLAEVSDGD